jgi:hypothetical protein
VNFRGEHIDRRQIADAHRTRTFTDFE